MSESDQSRKKRSGPIAAGRALLSAK